MSKVTALSRSKSHSFIKSNEVSLNILQGLGVEGDAHMGEKVKHRSRVAKDPDQPNLRQVHLIHSELFEELAEKGFNISAGQMGENITTQGIDLLSLPTDSILKIGPEVQVQLTGLRNPCAQLESIKPGLMKALLDRDENGDLIRKAGVMSIVLRGGIVRVDDAIELVLPPKPYVKMDKV